MVTTGGRGISSRVGVDRAFEADLDVALGDALDAVAELLHHQFGGVGVEGLGDGRHHAQLHQRLDHVGRARGHAVGEFLHGDGVRQDDFAHDLHLIGAQPLQFGLAALALALAADGGEAADAVVLALDGRLHVDLAGTAAVVDALLGRRAPAACAAAARRAPGRRTGRASSSSSPARAVLQAQRLGRRRRAGAARRARRRAQRRGGASARGWRGRLRLPCGAAA